MKLSIITCTKNSEKYLDDNIRSVSEQTFHDYEHIFIDGESTDQTKFIIEKYRAKYPEKIRFYSFPPKGIADAMNKGVELSRGEYLVHLHSDDFLYDKDVLGDVVKFLEKNDCDWIYSGESRIDSTGKTVPALFNKKIFKLGSRQFICRYLLKYLNFIRHQSVFISKDVFNRFGYFDKTYDVGMDYEYWLRIKDETKWVYFNKTVDCFRVHDGGTSSSLHLKNKTLLDEMIASRKYMNWFEFYILRPMFKILAHTAANTEMQIQLYRSFYKLRLPQKKT